MGFRRLLREDQQSGLVAAVRYPVDFRWNFEEIHDYCYAHGFTIYPGKISGTDTFRLCALGAIDDSDIRDFFVVFKEAVDRLGIKIPVRYGGERDGR